ncbi:MAG: class I SAM-dependent methyltransferase [Hyphomonadaceae bacterium]|nr:class I SAM-dependent methyltransferase [Hyphomonadaceae bacterium]
MLNTLAHVVPFTPYPYVGERVVCNLCGSDEIRLICDVDRRWKRLRTVACADCGLMRTDPMPTESELDEYYRHLYRLDYQAAGDEPPKYHLVRSWREARARAAYLASFLTPGARILDFGCGTGEFLKLAADAGCQVVGIEPSETYAAYARRTHGLDVLCASWRACQLPAQSFDLIVCREVLEHLRDPVDAIGAIATWLRPGGAAYLAVPDMRANDKPSFERFHFAHVYGFTPETLAAAAARHGLAPRGGELPNATKAIFQKREAYDVPLRDRSRAEALVRQYPKQSVLGHVLFGRYFSDAMSRFGKWRRDSALGRRRGAEPA